VGTSTSLGQRALSAALLCTALTLGMTACGNGSTTAKSSPLSGLSAAQIAGKAIANLKTASTVHVAGPTKDAGQTGVLNMSLVHGKGCQGTLALQGKGSVLLVVIGKLTWIKADSLFLKSYGVEPAALSILSGKYIKTTTNSASGSGLSTFCDPSELASGIGDHIGRLVKGTTTTISGHPALQVRDPTGSDSMYVSISAQPRILRLGGGSIANGGHLDFTAYDSPVQLTAPPASQTLDGAKYGF
jgi:hypothetical protein